MKVFVVIEEKYKTGEINNTFNLKVFSTEKRAESYIRNRNAYIKEMEVEE